MIFFLAVLGCWPGTHVEAAKMTDAQLRALYPIWRGKRTTEDVLERYADIADERMKPHFVKAGVPFPPERISLLAFKEERVLELWAWHKNKWVHVLDWPVKGASGRSGPKLKQGDKQVPEGYYRVTLLNPNSNFHLSMKLDYPNAFDRQKAAADGRSNLGGDIFIHGTSSSVGCLALGNEPIQELYTLAARIGIKNIETIIAPYDLRHHKPVKNANDPAWVDELYADLGKRLAAYPRAKVHKPAVKEPFKKLDKEAKSGSEAAKSKAKAKTGEADADAKAEKAEKPGKTAKPEATQPQDKAGVEAAPAKEAKETPATKGGH